MMESKSISKDLKSFVRRRLAANALMGIIRFIAVSAIYVFIYPFLLRSLGPARFGLWALLCIPSQYLALGDLGISNALIKFASESPLGENRERLAYLTGAATIVFLFLGGTLTAAVFALQNEILRWLRISPELVPEARVLLIGMAAVIWISLLASVYTALLSGLHRMDWVHAIQIATAAINGVGIVLAIKLHGGLAGLLLSNAVAALVTWLAALSLAESATRIRWTILPRANWSAVHPLLSFGAFLYVAGLSSLLMEPCVKVLLTRYGNLELVSYFELASRIPLQARTLFANVTYPLLPAASLLMADLESIRKLFARTMKLLWLSAVPAFLVLAGFATPIMRVWLGKDIPMAATAMALLSLGWLFNILTIPAYLFVQGLNHPRSAMICALLQGSICAIGSYVLIPHFGLYGAVLSEFVGLFVAASYVLRHFFTLCPMSSRETMGQKQSHTFAIPVIFAAYVFVAGQLIPISSLAGLAALTCLSLTFYVGLSFRGEGSGTIVMELVREFLPAGRELKAP
jgi:O-antigen/teichoic acid export membrane protein